jgi:poly(hydroxyalkanoate) depolymerase family esterase
LKALRGQAPKARSGGGLPGLDARFGDLPLGGLPGAGLTGLRPGGTGHPPALADGARWDGRRHVGVGAARDVRVHVPASVMADGAAGLIVMLHGCTQTPEDFATGTAMGPLAEAHRLVIAYPGQDRAANAQGCWSWFQTGDQGRSGESGMIAGMASELMEEFGLSGQRAFVAGLSAGGAMAAATAAAHPEVFAGAGIHSGLAPGAARDVMSAFAAMRGDGTADQAGPTMPAILFHGDADRTVAPAAADWASRDLVRSATVRREAGGRDVTVTAGRTTDGHPVELWRIAGAGHAWSGGDPKGSYADAAGPDASAEMVRFFLSLPRGG